MQDWDFWFSQTLWLNIGIVMVVSLTLFLFLRTLVNRLSKQVAAWAESSRHCAIDWSRKSSSKPAAFCSWLFPCSWP